MINGKYPITEKKEIGKGIFDVRIKCPDIVKAAYPGQFVHIAADGFTLRRPISICEIDKDGGILRIVFEIRGGGTLAMSKLQQGGSMDIIAPLGKGFEICPEHKNPFVIGGGIGVPPLLGLCKQLENPTAVLGFRNTDAVILKDEFEQNSDTYICTDDGSCGFHGNTAQKLSWLYDNGQSPDIIYACGPRPMIDAVMKFADEHNIPAQVSLEERMACGIGACLVCACKAVKDGNEYYAHVCKDGPVFEVENGKIKKDGNGY